MKTASDSTRRLLRAVVCVFVVLIMISIVVLYHGYSEESKSTSISSLSALLDSPDEHYGKVVIVLARGRSGSTYLCRVVENIFDVSYSKRYHRRQKTIRSELFGGTAEKMLRVANPTEMMRLFLLGNRRSHRKNVIGFKWKPIVDTPLYDEAYRFAVQHGFKFLYIHRNPLDELISRRKHSASKEGSDSWSNALGAHCSTRKDSDTEACLQQFKNLKIDVNVSKMVEQIVIEMNETLSVRWKLEQMNAQFIEANYEDLVYGSEQQRLANLQRVIDFLVPAHRNRQAKMQDFDSDLLITTAKSQADVVRNYDELTTAVKRAGFTPLLH